MVEKNAKVKTADILKDVADKFGYKLVKAERKTAPLELPETTKDYEGMSSRELALELKDITADITKEGMLNDEARKAVILFVNDKGSQPNTAPLFAGQRRVDERKVVVKNQRYNLLCNLKKHIENLYQLKLEKELTADFIKEKPELKGVISKLQMIENPTGQFLEVSMTTAKPKNLKLEALKKENEENKPTGVTTSQSINK
jgi:hypothetical protein